MAKRALKTRIAAQQQNLCDLSGQPLADEQALNDTDRRLPKASAGIYTDENTRVVEPRAHMLRHGTLRTREEALDHLKTLFDSRVQFMKLMLKINNQLLAYERRTDHVNPETAAFLIAQLAPIEAKLSSIDKEIEQSVKLYPDKFVQTALKVRGLGPITVAALTVYIDLGGRYTSDDRAVKDGLKKVDEEKAPTPSSLWKYVGIDAPSHERHQKGVAGGGNKTLRTVLWNTANVMMKLGEGGYREVYDRTKTRLAASEKLVMSRNTQGKLVEVAWKDTKPCHRHGAALRAVMKHVLADYWLVGRTMAGLRTTPLYAEAMLGHTHIISPRERGWVYDEP